MGEESYTKKRERILQEQNTDIDTTESNIYSLDLPDELMRNVTPAKMRVANLYMTGVYTKKQIAEIVGVAPGTVGKWLHSSEVMAVMDELQERDLKLSQTHINSLREEAINTMKKLLDSNMDNVRFQAAKDILDRSGMKAINVSKINKTVTTLDQQIANLAEFTICDDDVVDINLEELNNTNKPSGEINSTNEEVINATD